MSSTYPNERLLAGGTVADVTAASGGSSESAVSWAAVIAGAVAAASVSVMLLVFGAGLGLSSVSPWPHSGISATSFTVLAAIWLVIVQWVSAGLGGYIAGRLRTKWVGLHTDEVFFRDTAHGFLAWGLGVVVVAILLSLGSGAAVTAGTQATANSPLTRTAQNYYVDMLFRVNANPSGTALAPDGNGSAGMVTGLSDQAARTQATNILAESALTGNVTSEDNTYLTQLVSGRTGLAPADAQTRVSTVIAQEQSAINKAKGVADTIRKASAEAAIYTFVSLLIGAFIASVAGAIGGRLRDTY